MLFPGILDIRLPFSLNDFLKNGKENTSNLIEIAKLLLKLGSIAFGGPAAHIAMFEDEIVAKRNWMGRQAFSGSSRYS